ncbi:MAG: substrate-binding domain-containing protein [Verrucomicrobiota bacterium JB023]|nr:substrate-binding domain-containing protein [Verrucomicrobiota bacterium JB023]
MAALRILSAVEQVAAHLRSQIASGELSGSMPGVTRLASELEVNHKTVEAAMEQLETEGVLKGQGPRRKRLIVSQSVQGTRGLRIGLFLYEPADHETALFVDIEHALREAGHVVHVPEKTLTDLKMDRAAIQRLVSQTSQEAWIVVSASLEILDWFASQPAPLFALFGRRGDLRMASTGPSIDLAFAETVKHLIEIGHRRIVRICRSERRFPSPGRTEQLLLDILREHSIPTSDYNLPDWEETPDGMQELLQRLFNVTPPTALIIDEAIFLPVILQFAGRAGLQIPRDLSLICFENSANFDWCKPSIAHIHWERNTAVRRILRWSTHIAHGKTDLLTSSIPAKFIPGGTVGPASDC